MIRSLGSQVIGAQMINATTGAAFVGAVTVYITGDGGVQSLGSVGAGVCTAEGNGYFTYAPSQAETDFALIAFTFIGAGAIPATVQVATVTQGQQQSLVASTGPGAISGQDYTTEALRELGVIGAVDAPAPEDSALMLGIMNRILDDWNADKKGVYAWDFLAFTLTPNLSPHTIGPTGTFVVNSRPQQIVGASLVLNNVTPNVSCDIRIVDSQWWQGQTIPDLATSIPTDLFFDPQWPNGNLYFWPVPTVAYGVQLQVPILLNQVTLISTISLPPGYHSALVLTMAEQGANSLKVDLSPVTAMQARRARARIFDANDETPALVTRDAGIPQSGETGSRTSFNYLSRTWGG